MEQQNLDNKIIAEFREGNPRALSAIFKLFYTALCFFAERLVNDRPAAEDIVEEAFLKLWDKHTDFETLQNVKAFLYISTRNACLNFLKQAQRQSAHKKELAYMATEKEEFVLNTIIKTEVLRDIYEEIEKLPVRCRKVFKMSYLSGLKNHEIADQLHISVNTVKNQKVRAIQLLKLKLLNKNLVLVYLLLYLLLQ